MIVPAIPFFGRLRFRQSILSSDVSDRLKTSRTAGASATVA